MPDLTVPAPTLKFEPVEVDLAVLEKPLEVQGGPVARPDGTGFGVRNLGTAGFFSYRQKTGGSPVEVFDEGSRTWIPAPGGAPAGVEPKPFIPREGEPVPWQGLVVAAGQTDASGAPIFEKALGPFPRYFFRAYFVDGVDPSTSGLGPPSPSLRFVSMVDANRAGLRLAEGETPENATEVELFLRNASRRVIGSVRISGGGGAPRIDIANRDAAGLEIARVSLLPNGDVEIQPASGRSLRVSGPVDADRIFYQPADPSGRPVGPKRWLA